MNDLCDNVECPGFDPKAHLEMDNEPLKASFWKTKMTNVVPPTVPDGTDLEFSCIFFYLTVLEHCSSLDHIVYAVDFYGLLNPFLHRQYNVNQ